MSSFSKYQIEICISVKQVLSKIIINYQTRTYYKVYAHLSKLKEIDSKSTDTTGNFEIKSNESITYLLMFITECQQKPALLNEWMEFLLVLTRRWRLIWPFQSNRDDDLNIGRNWLLMDHWLGGKSHGLDRLKSGVEKMSIWFPVIIIKSVSTHSSPRFIPFTLSVDHSCLHLSIKLWKEEIKRWEMS